jgi:hypothetical protein
MRFKNHETPAGKASSEDPAGVLCRGAEEMPAASECIYEAHLILWSIVNSFFGYPRFNLVFSQPLSFFYVCSLKSVSITLYLGIKHVKIN